MGLQTDSKGGTRIKSAETCSTLGPQVGIAKFAYSTNQAQAISTRRRESGSRDLRSDRHRSVQPLAEVGAYHIQRTLRWSRDKRLPLSEADVDVDKEIRIRSFVLSPSHQCPIAQPLHSLSEHCYSIVLHATISRLLLSSDTFRYHVHLYLG